MKFVVALLTTAVLADGHREKEGRRAREKEGRRAAGKGEACDANGMDTGCADGLRCHLGKRATAMGHATTARPPKTCRE